MSPRKIVLLVLVAWNCNVLASDCFPEDARCKKLSKLVNLLGYEVSITTFQRSCYTQADAYRPEILLQKDRQLFGRLNEKSARWPLVIRAFQTYTQEYCEVNLRQLMLEGYRDVWGRQLSDRQLDDLLAFLETSSGKAFSHSFPAVYEQLTEMLIPRFNEIGQKAYLRYAETLRNISNSE